MIQQTLLAIGLAAACTQCIGVCLVLLLPVLPLLARIGTKEIIEREIALLSLVDDPYEQVSEQIFLHGLMEELSTHSPRAFLKWNRRNAVLRGVARYFLAEWERQHGSSSEQPEHKW